MKAHPDVTFTVEGDADQRGSIRYNLFLSDERALAVRDELVKLGVPEKQILFATGMGEGMPRVSAGRRVMPEQATAPSLSALVARSGASNERQSGRHTK